MSLVMPLFVGIFTYSVVSKSLIHKIPIGIVDMDNSALTRQIAFDINATSALNIASYYPSVLEAKAALANKEIYGLVVFPKNLESDTKKGIMPSVAAYYNAELVFVGKNIQSALTLVFKTRETTLAFAKHIADSKNTTLAMAQSVVFLPQIISLYNPKSDFSQFLLTAILPCSWQLFIVLCMIALIAHDEKDVGFVPHKENPIREFYRHLGVKFLINSVIFFAWWVVMNLAFYNLAYPNNGNVWILALNALVTLFAYNCIGIFIYALIGYHVRAISIAAFYAAPSLAFIGITYPLNSMELFPTFWSSILPITRYMQVVIQQENYGIENIYSLQLIAQNLVFFLFGILGAMIYRKKKPL